MVSADVWVAIESAVGACLRAIESAFSKLSWEVSQLQQTLSIYGDYVVRELEHLRQTIADGFYNLAASLNFIGLCIVIAAFVIGIVIVLCTFWTNRTLTDIAEILLLTSLRGGRPGRERREIMSEEAQPPEEKPGEKPTEPRSLEEEVIRQLMSKQQAS